MADEAIDLDLCGYKIKAFSSHSGVPYLELIFVTSTVDVPWKVQICGLGENERESDLNIMDNLASHFTQ